MERFPYLQFVSTRIENGEPRQYRVFGELTLHGVTRELTLEVEYAGRTVDPWGKDRVAFTAKVALDRVEAT